MNDQSESVHCVKALFAFKGTHNDELVFGKGDIVTVTQAIDGGWWEGTLNAKTGWFPSNYVKDVKLDLAATKDIQYTEMGPHNNMLFYHNVVLHNVIETEKMHVGDITGVLQKYIRPLRASMLLSYRNVVKLVDHLEEICTLKRNFLTALEDTARVSHGQRRVGGVFMKFAPHMRGLFEQYCSHHPGAIADLQQHVDEINTSMEDLGAPCPGSLVLITCLSQPFTRLEKYSSLLKELERHIEENHIDRGDTQRAITVYRDISILCFEIRKRREMENEITSNEIQGWEGEEIQKLGEVLHISKIKVHTLTGEKLERVAMLFPTTLVLLSMGAVSGYQYEGKIPLTCLQVTRCEDKDNHTNSFEISGASVEKLVFACGTYKDMVQWSDLMNEQITRLHHKPPSSLPANITAAVPPPNPALTSPTSKTPKAPSQGTLPSHRTSQRTWTMTCLCPAPPLRPVLNYSDTLPHRKSGNVRKKQDRQDSVNDKYDLARKPYDPRMYEMDGAILRVIEAYCNSAKSRHTVGSSVFEAANVILPEEEKLIIECDSGDNNPALEEKSLVDTVYSLTSQVKLILQEQKKLRSDVDDERKMRKILESSIRKLQKVCVPNIANGEMVA